jgi:protein TonB
MTAVALDGPAGGIARLTPKVGSLALALSLHAGVVGALLWLPRLETPPAALGSFEVVELPSFGAAPPEPEPEPAEDPVEEETLERPPAPPPDPVEEVQEPSPETPPPEPVVEETPPEQEPPQPVLTAARPLVPEALPPMAKPSPKRKPKPEPRRVAAIKPRPEPSLAPPTRTVKSRPKPKPRPQSAAAPGAAAYVPPRSNAAYLNNPKPAYPPLARRRHMEGTVILWVEVGADGRPLSVTVKRGSRFAILDKAAVDAVRRWRFVPAKRFGRAVSSAVEVPIRFRLTDA